MTNTVQYGNEGVKVIVHVVDQNGGAVNLTGAINLKIKLRAAVAKTGKSFTAAFEGDPSLGSVAATLGTGDIDALATWKAQAYYELGIYKIHTRPVPVFFVEGNLA